MATNTQQHTFGVQRLDRRLDLRVDLGRVSFGPEGQLTVVKAQPKFENYLANIVETVNARKELSVKVPPPKSAPPFSVAFKSVARTDPGLLDAMRLYLDQKYSLELVDEKG